MPNAWNAGQQTAAAYAPYEATIGIVPLPVVEDYGPRIERGEVGTQPEGKNRPW